MSFICSQHRAALQRSPVEAMQFWKSTLSQSRHYVSRKRFHKAVRSYSSAMEVSEILLANEGDKNRAWSRYIATVIELIFVLRKCKFQNSVDTLLSRVIGQYQKLDLKEIKQTWLSNLQKAAGISGKGYWLTALHSQEQLHNRVLH